MKTGEIIEKLLESSANPPKKGILSIFELKLESQEEIRNSFKASKKEKVREMIRDPDGGPNYRFEMKFCNKISKTEFKDRIRNVIKSVFEVS